MSAFTADDLRRMAVVVQGVAEIAQDNGDHQHLQVEIHDEVDIPVATITYEPEHGEYVLRVLKDGT
jgi:hypothetical protein